MGRYLHRVAIANSRIEAFEDGRVTFRYRDGKTGETKRRTLEAEQFIGRFLQHVLPRGFPKVRAWGLYSSRANSALERARALLAASADPGEEAPANPPLPFQMTTEPCTEDADPPCPRCKTGRLRIVQVLPPITSLPPSHARAPP